MENDIELFNKNNNEDLIHCKKVIDKTILSKEKNISILETWTDPDYQIDSNDIFDTFSFYERSLYLCSEITQEHAVDFYEFIRFWNRVDEIDGIPKEERNPIKIYIDTPGGDLDAVFSIIDSITLSSTPVWTITFGKGFSGGFFIGISGNHRIGYPSSSYLFHEGCNETTGDAHKYLEEAMFYKRRLSQLQQLVLKHTKITEEEYSKYKKDDLWLTAEDALKYNVIDEIATTLK